MIRVSKVFSVKSTNRQYSMRVRDTLVWVSEGELISLVAEIRKALPKKKQVPFSEHSMPSGGMEVMVPYV